MHSKWMEVENVNSATAQGTSEHHLGLGAILARFSLHEVVVTDNGTYLSIMNFRRLPSVTISGTCELLPTILLLMD